MASQAAPAYVAYLASGSPIEGADLGTQEGPIRGDEASRRVTAALGLRLPRRLKLVHLATQEPVGQTDTIKGDLQALVVLSNDPMCTCSLEDPYAWCYIHAPNCFVGDTPVRMADGSCKPLATVKVGDRVQSFDVASGKEISGTIVQALRSARATEGWQSTVFRHEGTGVTETFVHTPQHEWLTTGHVDESKDDAEAPAQNGWLGLGWANMETQEEFDRRMRASRSNTNNSGCSKWSRALQLGDLVVGCSSKSWTLVSSSRLPSAQKHVMYNLVVDGYGSSANLFSVGSAGGLFVMGKPGGLNPFTHQGRSYQQPEGDGDQ